MSERMQVRRLQTGDTSNVVVIGLGRFGTAMAVELERSGVEVLGVDEDEKLVQALAGEITHVVRADSTDEQALLELGVKEFDAAVVAIGGDVEASILTTSLLLEIGVPSVWAKAVSEPHGRILERLGVEHVVFPEHDMGRRVAHMVSGNMLDWVEIDNDFAVVKTSAPQSLESRPLVDLGIRKRYGVTVLATREEGGTFTHATPDTVIHPGDLLLVAGRTTALESFCRLR